MAESPVFGRNIRIGAPLHVSAPIVMQTLARLGYKLKTPAGQLPASFKWGSLGTELLVNSTTELLPIGLIPGVWKRSMPARVTVSAVNSDATTSIVRVDSRPLTSTRLFASPHFVKHIDKVVAALAQAGIAAEADPLTDTVQPGLG